MKRRIFRSATTSPEPLALSPEAFGLFFLFGCTKENETIGTARVVSIEGPLEQRAAWWDGYDAILSRFDEALADEETTSVVLRLDSPGGECAGLFEAVRMMRERKEASGKRVVAYVDEGAYSAAFALACVADEIYLPPAGGVGSIGVIATCLDRTEQNAMIGVRVEVVTAGKRKADCHPDVPLSEDAIAVVEARVDGLAALFYGVVSESRGIKASAVAALEAGCFYGEDAIAAGLADGVLGFDEVIAMLAEDDSSGDTAGALPGKETTMNLKGQIGKSAPAATSSAESKTAAKAVDVLAEPRVAGFTASPLASSEESADATEAPADAAKSKSKKKTKTTVETYESTESESSPDAEDEEKDDAAEGEEEAPSDDEEESTKASDEESAEGEEEAAEDDEDAPGDEEEEPDGDEAEKAAASAVAVAARTSGDVLKAVREITGETSPSKQAAKLTALAKDAAETRKLRAKAAKAEAKSKRAEIASKVDAAIREGRLTPAARASAIEAGLASPKALDGMLKAAKPVAPRTPLAAKAAPKAPNGKSVDAPSLSESDRRVAATLMIDPAALAAHKSSIVTH